MYSWIYLFVLYRHPHIIKGGWRNWCLIEMNEISTLVLETAPQSLIHWHFTWFSIFFFLRKISPELTSANPPLFFLRKTGPELTSMPILLYFICGTPTTPWLAKWCRVHTQDSNQQTPGCRSGMWALYCCATRLAPYLVFKQSAS